jgi:hypothetical protein
MMADALAQFLSITGADETQAQHFLSASNGDIERAVDLFFQNPSAGLGGDAGAPANLLADQAAADAEMAAALAASSTKVLYFCIKIIFFHIILFLTFQH